MRKYEMLYILSATMSDEEKDLYIKSHPEYGKIICRCEGVTEGEILHLINTDLNGVIYSTKFAAKHMVKNH